ncbi:hypothetical protein [Streptomyces sp. NPDC052292]|uniref:hypothetical protein n=1 Tax=Streptomyces sp. NPDC052292 TaxID=3155053 RepID=UPI00344381A3
MADLSTTQLIVIGLIVVVVLSLIVLGLRRGSLKSANFQGLGVRAGVEGGQESPPLTDQTMQTDDFKSKRSEMRIVKSARTSFKRTRFTDTTLEILPDDGTNPPNRTSPENPSAGQSTP